MRKNLMINGKTATYTERELKVLNCFCEGLSQEEIAEKMRVSTNTIRYYTRNIRAKSGFDSTYQLAIYILRNEIALPV